MSPKDRFDQAIASIKQAIPGVQAIYLYGSHAQGRARADSDIDLAVLAEAPVEQQLVGETLSRLQLAYGDVDLVDLREVPLTLAVQVIDGGVVLYSTSEKARTQWETTTMSRYANLNEERRDILEDVKRRGKIYE